MLFFAPSMTFVDSFGNFDNYKEILGVQSLTKIISREFFCLYGTKPEIIENWSKIWAFFRDSLGLGELYSTKKIVLT